MTAAERLPPGEEEIAALAEAALAGLPAEMRAACSGLVIRVADFADEETLAELGIGDPFELTGLYRGTALTEKSVADWGTLPDEVWLYRRAILEEWIERADAPLGDIVANVLVHEIAHHFGWSDEEIAAVDDWRL